MRILEISKDSKYNLSLFAESEITALESRITEKSKSDALGFLEKDKAANSGK